MFVCLFIEDITGKKGDVYITKGVAYLKASTVLSSELNNRLSKKICLPVPLIEWNEEWKRKEFHLQLLQKPHNLSYLRLNK